jgi:hypothetical protein
MKRLFLILILLLSFQSLTRADDIRDYDIEGIGVGDSLLNFFSEEEIENKFIYPNYYKNDEFFDIEIYNHKKFNTYDGLQISLKKNDQKYEVYAIVGVIFYKKDVQECFNQVETVSKEISNLLKNSKKISALRNHEADPSGKSRVKDVVFKHKSGSILLECFDWSKEITEQKNWVDNFGVSLYSTQFYTWLNTKAY